MRKMLNEKKFYEKATIELISLHCGDIMTLSTEPSDPSESFLSDLDIF